MSVALPLRRRLEAVLQGRAEAALVVLLTVALVLVITGLGAVTIRTVRQQRQFTQRTLREIAGMGAWGFARRTHGMALGVALTYASMEALDSPERGPDRVRILHAMDSLERCDCGTFARARGVATGRFGDPASVRYVPLVEGARPDSAARLAALRRYASDTLGRGTELRLLAWTPDSVRAVSLVISWARIVQTDRSRFFVVDLLPDAFARQVLARQFAEAYVLPAGLLAGLLNPDAVVVDVRAAGGPLLWRSATRADTSFSARTAMPAKSEFDVTVALTSTAIAAIVRGDGAAPTGWVIWGGPLLALLLLAATALALRRALVLAQARTQFATAVSHELRTPLTHILLNAETLQYGRVRDEAERTATTHTLVREARRLVHLIENVLHFSRAERWALRVRNRPVRLDLVVATRGEELAPLVEAAGGMLNVHVPDPVPVLADPDAIQLVLTNLVDNAAKYGRGLVEVSVRVAPDGRGELRVDDRGAGIAPEDRRRVLEPFVRLRDAQSR
ncbi:MAG: HAMP domain-containing histidine kinase, partial [Gemmatimonadetes bacterium]|nr:HAMP domain-containing histidine kinase [Gemmatimonadota bacterium]